MFQAIFSPSSGAQDWDFYSIWYSVLLLWWAGFGERQRGTTCTVWRKQLPSYRTCSWRWAKDWPKHVEL